MCTSFNTKSFVYLFGMDIILEENNLIAQIIKTQIKHRHAMFCIYI